MKSYLPTNAIDFHGLMLCLSCRSLAFVPQYWAWVYGSKLVRSLTLFSQRGIQAVGNKFCSLGRCISPIVRISDEVSSCVQVARSVYKQINSLNFFIYYTPTGERPRSWKSYRKGLELSKFTLKPHNLVCLIAVSHCNTRFIING